MSSKKILVVGERANLKGLTPENLVPIEDSYDLEWRLFMGAFRSGSSLRRLRAIGFSDFDAMNIHPARTTVSNQLAENLASKVIQRCHESRVTLVLLGSVVCSAFKVPYDPLTCWDILGSGLTCAVLPHPSGRCRFWNHGMDRAKDFVRRLPVMQGGWS